MTAARNIRVLLVSGVLACFSLQALAAIGTVQFAVGSVQVRDAAGNLRTLRKGDTLNEGEAIVTGATGQAQVKMIDGGILAIRPDTELKLDTYHYAGREDGTESALMSLVKGGFRTITGFIGRVNKSRYTIHTPTATVGIRGTDHEPFFIAPNAPRAGAAPGTYDKVNLGVAYIASGGAEQNIAKNQMGYAAPNQPPVLLPVNVELFKATPPVQKPAAPAPKPAAQAEEKVPEKTGEKPAAEKAPEGTPPAGEQQPAPVAAVEPPPPPPPAAPPPTVVAPPPPAPIVQTITGTDAEGNVLNFTTLNLTAFTAGGASTFDHIVFGPSLFEAAPAPQPESNYEIDNAGNVGSFTTTQTGTTLVFNGTAQDSFVSNDIRLGRWQGGSYTLNGVSVPLGAASAHWIFGLQPPLGLVQRFSGTVDYAPFASTSPTDKLGNAGTLISAPLTADFTSQTVSAGVNVSIAGRSLQASIGGMPISNNTFGGTTPSALCSGTGCDSSYSASMDGAFAGAAAKKAMLAYDFSGNVADVVQGVIAYQAGSTPQIGAANSAILAATDAATAASQIAATLLSIGMTTQAAQAQTAANNATAAATAVNNAVSTLFAATTTTGAQQSLNDLDAAVSNAITVASQTVSLVQNLLAVAGPAPLAQAAADQAQLSADAAFAAYNAALGLETQTNNAIASLNLITPVDTSSAMTAILNATSARDAAQTSLNNVTSQPAPDVALAQANAATSAGLHTTVHGQFTQAETAFVANGSFADATYAVPAFNATQAATTIVHNSDVLIQQAALDAASFTATLNTAIAAAQSALSNATSALATANTQLTTATNNNTIITNAQSAVVGLSSQVAAATSAAYTAATAAQTAATNAQAAATQAASLQAAGDLTGAQSQLNIALAELSNANTQLTAAQSAQAQAQTIANTANSNLAAAQAALTAASSAVSAALTAANSALSYANTAQTQADAAAAAHTSAVNAVNTTTSELASNVQPNAAVVAANYKQAQYSNPAVASSNFVHFGETVVPVTTPTTGVERRYLETLNDATLPNTNYVLNENKDLIEVRSSVANGEGWMYQGTPINDANVKFSGGTANDHYEAGDGTAYMGRWQGGTITITDNTGTVAPFSLDLGSQSGHWIVALLPGYSSTISNVLGPVSNAQTVIGTRAYTLSGSTQPTDGFGNVGTLNSASFSADFTSQTVNAAVNVGFLGRGITLNGVANNVPIRQNGFEGKNPTVNCSGSGCGTTGWVGNIGGKFLASASAGTTTGALGTGIGLGYEFLPVVPSPSPAAFSDFIHGLAVFNTTTAPDAGITNVFANNANVRGEAIYPGVETATGNFYLPVARNFIHITVPAVATLGSSATTVNTNYLFDASGNLVRVFDTPYVIFDRGTSLAPNTTQFAAPTQIVDAQLSFGGGGAVAADRWDYTPAGDATPMIRMGRWQGGFLNVTDLSADIGYIDPLGSRSVQWLVYQGTTLPVSGEFHYTRIASGAGFGYATSPTDSYGNVGTLEAANLAVDFSRMSTSAALRVLMPQGPGGSLGLARIGARYSDAPLNAVGEINVSSDPTEFPGLNRLFVGCTTVSGAGCAPNTNYGGRIRGGFAGANADAAWLRYSFHPNYATPTDAASNGRAFVEYTNGLVALQKGPQIVQPSTNVLSPAPNPPGDASILSAYSWSNTSCSPTPCTQNQTSNYEAAGSANAWQPLPGYTIDASGNLTSVSSNLFPGDSDSSLTLTGGTGATNASAPNGISHGYWLQGGSLTLNGTDWNGTVSNRQPLDSFHWLRGPMTYPVFSSEAAIMPFNAVGPIAYAQLGGFVTDQSGNPGSVTATLGVNFNRQSVDASINTNVLGNIFAATANGLALDDGGGFWASSGNEPKHSFSSLNFTPTGSMTPMSAWGSMNGQLMGPGLNGAGLAFAFQTGSTDRATGTAVFGNPTYSDGTTTVPYQLSDLMNYRLAIRTIGMTGAGAVTRDGTPYDGTPAGGQLADEEENYRVAIGGLSSNRTQSVVQTTGSNPAGAVVKFDGSTPVVSNFCSPTPCNNVNRIPAVLAVADSSGFGPTGPTLANPTIVLPTAHNLEFGFDPDTGISWGRWGGGMMNVGDRNSPNQASPVPTNNGGGTQSQIDLMAKNLHYVLTGAQTGPVTLPTTDISGTFTTYNLVGGTSPTGYTANIGQSVADIGTLNSATLTAHFSAAIPNVDVSVNASTLGTGTWAASANNVPILAGTGFFAGKSLDGTGNLTVTRTPPGGSPTSTRTAGQILGGFAGPTGRGAAFGYALNQNGPLGSTINGVAVFKR